MHPYAIRQEVIELTGRQVFPAHSSVAGAIDSLLARGYIESCWSDPHYWMKARRSEPYQLTPSGEHKIKMELGLYFEVLSSVELWKVRHEAMESKQNGRQYDHLLLAKYPFSPKQDPGHGRR
jgi:DNA-binding PadR family transcriptional regulator